MDIELLILRFLTALVLPVGGVAWFFIQRAIAKSDQAAAARDKAFQEKIDAVDKSAEQKLLEAKAARDEQVNELKAKLEVAATRLQALEVEQARALTQLAFTEFRKEVKDQITQNFNQIVQMIDIKFKVGSSSEV